MTSFVRYSIVGLLLWCPAAWGQPVPSSDTVTAAGTSATSATAVQGVPNGVPAPVVDSTGANFASVVTAITNNALSPVTAAAPTVSASASVTSLVLKASATIATGGVKYFHAENITSTAGYCVLYNGTSAPSTGALTAANVLGFQFLPASGFCDWTATNVPIAASTGAVVLVTSAATPFTYTTGTITAAIYGLAQ